jgi:hypothetical protein
VSFPFPVKTIAEVSPSLTVLFFLQLAGDRELLTCGNRCRKATFPLILGGLLLFQIIPLYSSFLTCVTTSLMAGARVRHVRYALKTLSMTQLLSEKRYSIVGEKKKLSLAF